jgi:hypothetical protein
MRYDLYQDAAGGAQQTVSNEERMMKAERKRVANLVKDYHSNPGRWQPQMVEKLKQMTDRYDMPWAPASATWLENLGAGVGGAADAMAFDFIPDKLYSSAKTAGAAKTGKLVGLAGSLLTGGAALKGAAALGKMGMAGKVAGGAIKYGTAPGLAGQFTSGAGRLLAPAAQRAGMSAPWMKEGLKAATKGSQRKEMASLKNMIASGDKQGAIEILKASSFSGKRKQMMVRGTAEKLFGKKDKILKDAFIKGIGNSVGDLGSGVSSKFVNFLQGSSTHYKALNPGNVSKIAKKMKLGPEDTEELKKVLSEYDNISDFLMAHWKSLGSVGEAAANVGMDLSALAPTALSGLALASTLDHDVE